MERIDHGELAVHLEAALMMAPPATLAALQATDRRRRNAAITRVAEHLATRLDGFKLTLADVDHVEKLEQGSLHLSLELEQQYGPE